MHLDVVQGVTLNVPHATAADRLGRWRAACRREGLDYEESTLEELAAKLRFSLGDVESAVRQAGFPARSPE